jgi:hypothetical protein
MNLVLIFYIGLITFFTTECFAGPYIIATEEPGISEKAAQYAIRLYIAKDDIGCSGTIVSPDGYVLTALHCVASCLTNPMLDRAITMPSGQVATGVELSRSPRNFCDLGQKLGQAEFIASGTLHMITATEFRRIAFSNLEDAFQLKELGYTAPAGRGDFAILKLQNRTNMACAKVANRIPIENEKIWSYSFPVFERGAKSIKGSAYYSEGVVRLDFFKPEDINSKIYDDPSVFWGTTDGEGGASGAATFTESDEILGILVSSVKQPNSYREGSTKNISIQSIIKNLESQIGKEKTKLIFNCH